MTLRIDRAAFADFPVFDTVSLQTEYAYTDLGSDQILSTEVFGRDRLTINEDIDFHSVKAAVNFRF